MKILVVDDSARQRKAAEMTLSEHELTIVSTAEEARELLTIGFSREKLEKMRKEAGLPNRYDANDEQKAVYKKLEEQCSNYRPDFDVVLTDLLMPGEAKGIGPQGSHHVGKETPYGFCIALLALKSKIAKVAIVSMGDHHDHPILWFGDSINGAIIPGFKVFMHMRMSEDDFPEVEEPWELKDWGKALKLLLE